MVTGHLPLTLLHDMVTILASVALVLHMLRTAATNEVINHAPATMETQIQLEVGSKEDVVE